jgi:hypothetical protein
MTTEKRGFFLFSVHHPGTGPSTSLRTSLNFHFIILPVKGVIFGSFRVHPRSSASHSEAGWVVTVAQSPSSWLTRMARSMNIAAVQPKISADFAGGSPVSEL